MSAPFSPPESESTDLTQSAGRRIGESNLQGLGRLLMFRTLTATTLLAVACILPAQQAAAQDAIGGAIFGGAAGALLGGAIGGRGGAVAGAIIGGTTGAAIAAEGERRRSGYYWYRNGCYVQRPDGAWIA